MSDNFTIETLFNEYGFTPNESQKKAIMTLEGPLFLTAGPGSGKTRVILWRTVNLIVFHNIKPEKIFLATFTEKAALQLKQGLQSLLSLASTHTGKPYDLGRMYIGTLHSLCQKLLADRHLNSKRTHQRAPALMDELNQFLFVYNRENLERILTAGQLSETGTDLYYRINSYFASGPFGATRSRSDCATNLISFFGRLTEENFEAEELNSDDELENAMFRMYLEYKEMLSENGSVRVDFSTLQQAAYDYLCESTTIDQYIKYVIVDEYQDTNTIQELIYFKLAEKTHNICVVGDDDQALYRFRGATVENLVFFDEKTKKYLGIEPTRIDLNINYRSRKEIVDTYTHYIEGGDWKPGMKQTSYRLDKNIVANSKDSKTSVVHISGNKKTLAEETAQLIKEMKLKGKITDYNQCAILFPGLRSNGEANSNVREFGEALKAFGIPHYAPRAYNFLYTEESLAMFGLMIKVFEPNIDEIDEDKKNKNRKEKFHVWLNRCENFANELIDDDPLLEKFIEDLKTQKENSLAVYKMLLKTLAKENQFFYGVGTGQPTTGGTFDGSTEVTAEITAKLAKTKGIPPAVEKLLTGRRLNQLILQKKKEGKPLTLNYILARCSSLDWTVLDLFYRFTCFDHFKEMFKKAETGQNEGPMYNLGLITQYLSTFMENNLSILSGGSFVKDTFNHFFFDSYLYALFNRGETEYEDEEDPFPKGCVPFITIHQSKGLEFPMVVLGSVNKTDGEARVMDKLVRKLRKDKNAEPLDMISNYDNLRMFYVALSRAKNLMVICQETKKDGSAMKATHPSFVQLFENSKLSKLDDLEIESIPQAKPGDDALPKIYSYTADYLPYLNCPRNYMVFHRFGFIPSRSQTMFFGSLVHESIDDLQQMFNAAREK